MNTQEKFGFSRLKGLALLLQLPLVLAATAGTVFVLAFSITNNAGPLFVAAYVAVLVAYVAVIFYACYGYRKNNAYYLGAVYAFCLAVQLNVLLPFRDTYQLVALTLLLSLCVVFAQHIDRKKAANALLVCMLAAALAFSVYATLTARTENLNDLKENVWSVAAMYISVWTPVIMTVTLGLAYSVRGRRP